MGRKFESRSGSQSSISTLAEPFAACFILLSWFERLKLSNGFSNSVHNRPSCQVADFNTSLSSELYGTTKEYQLGQRMFVLS